MRANQVMNVGVIGPWELEFLLESKTVSGISLYIHPAPHGGGSVRTVIKYLDIWHSLTMDL